MTGKCINVIIELAKGTKPAAPYDCQRKPYVAVVCTIPVLI